MPLKPSHYSKGFVPYAQEWVEKYLCFFTLKAILLQSMSKFLKFFQNILLLVYFKILWLDMQKKLPLLNFFDLCTRNDNFEWTYIKKSLA